MSFFFIVHRWLQRSIISVRAKSLSHALFTLVRQGVSLQDADLRGVEAPLAIIRGADLRGADLQHAAFPGGYLRGADLRGGNLKFIDLSRAFLQEADLRNTDLRGADLRGADLRRANLLGSDLRGADFTDARLDDAIIDWRASTVPLELLRRASSAPGSQPALVFAMLMSEESRFFSWTRFLANDDESSTWARGILSRSVRPGDNAPSILRRTVLREPQDEADSSTTLRWVRSGRQPSTPSVGDPFAGLPKAGSAVRPA
jgi:hypothetical protein